MPLIEKGGKRILFAKPEEEKRKVRGKGGGNGAGGVQKRGERAVSGSAR